MSLTCVALYISTGDGRRKSSRRLRIGSSAGERDALAVDDSQEESIYNAMSVPNWPFETRVL